MENQSQGTGLGDDKAELTATPFPRKKLTFHSAARMKSDEVAAAVQCFALHRASPGCNPVIV